MAKETQGGSVANEPQEAAPGYKTNQEPLVTETPAPSAPGKPTSQYVVTVDNNTGLQIKIEKLNEETNERKELSHEEYTEAFAYASLSYYSGLTGYVPSPESVSQAQAYYRGVTDYLKALTSSK